MLENSGAEADSVNPTSHRDKFVAAFSETAPERALEFAIAERRLEIDRYWRRAAYFWALIAAAFAGYFLLMTGEDTPQPLLFLVACVGFLFSFGWYLVNRGSKNWQEVWEQKVELLEDSVIGPLYKSSLPPPQYADRVIFAGPNSVTRVNLLLSIVVCVFWIILAFSKPVADDKQLIQSFLLGILTLCFVVLLLLLGRTGKTHVSSGM